MILPPPRDRPRTDRPGASNLQDVPDLHRLTGSSGPLTDDDLLAAYGWPETGRWLRAMMVTTLDGAAAGGDGLSGSVSSPADQRVFNSVRRHADAVLVGAQTLRAEQYTPMRAKPADAEARAAAGQLPAPVITVVSGSLDLPWELPIWAGSTHRPIVLTSAAAPAERLEIARTRADVITLEATTPRAILDAVTARGLRRIVCEGGPRLLRDLSAEGLVDEVDITIAPLLAGSAATPHTDLISPAAAFRLAHVLEGEGYLMTRYVKDPA
jgi:riboflavin biosynthesis pyrimidine reductase